MSMPAESTDRPSLAFALLTLVCLGGIAFLHEVYVLPVFAQLMHTLDTSFTTVPRMAIAAGPVVSWVSFGFLLLLGWLGDRVRRGTSSGVSLRRTLLGGNVIMAVYVAMMSWSYVDVAIAMPANAVENRQARDAAAKQVSEACYAAIKSAR